MMKTYYVFPLSESIQIDANWDKEVWQNTKSLEINRYLGERPGFEPITEVKMRYDVKNLYLIFRVKDRYVHCKNNMYNGPVSEDSCVEFFFSPDHKLPKRYFNLEVNCGGTPLMHYNIIPRKDFQKLNVDELKQIEIAHSLPSIVDKVINDSTTWTIEYKLPLEILRKYSNVSGPKKGERWRANFYKIADKGLNPHYVTWSPIDNPEPDFHLPQFFGEIIFQ